MSARRLVPVWLRRKQPIRWSFENWRKGYKFGPVQRCRTCDHTSPYHYPDCPKARR